MSNQENTFQVGDRVRVVLNAEVAAISTDREWLSLALVSRVRGHAVWVPIDEFVEHITIQQEGQHTTV